MGNTDGNHFVRYFDALQLSKYHIQQVVLEPEKPIKNEKHY